MVAFSLPFSGQLGWVVLSDKERVLPELGRFSVSDSPLLFWKVLFCRRG